MKTLKLPAKLPAQLIFIIFIMTTISCSDDDDGTTPPPTMQPPPVTVVTDYGTIELSAQNEIPANKDRPETGTATLVLMSDNTLAYSIEVNDLSASDQLTVAHIHSGNAAENGPVEITLVDNDQITFDGNAVTDTLTLTQDEVDLLSSGDFYVNVHSQEIPPGLVRGQLGENVTLALDVNLSALNEVPMNVGRSETGSAFLRLLADNTLVYTITVSGLSASDNLTVAHIHDGYAAINGPVLITLVNNDQIVFDDSTVNNSISLTEEEVGRLTDASEGEDFLYVNVHSEEIPPGLLRGQLEGDVVFGSDTELLTTNEVDPPVVGRPETGTAILRLLNNNTLFYSITVNDLDPTDELTVAHIHEGAAGTNGPVIITLVDNDQIIFEDGQASGQVELEEELATRVQNDELYVNVHSMLHPPGLLRGQVVN